MPKDISNIVTQESTGSVITWSELATIRFHCFLLLFSIPPSSVERVDNHPEVGRQQVFENTTIHYLNMFYFLLPVTVFFVQIFRGDDMQEETRL